MTRVLAVIDQLNQRAPGGIGTYVRGLGASGLFREQGNGYSIHGLASRPKSDAVRDEFRALCPSISFTTAPQPYSQRLWDAGLLGTSGSYDVLHSFSIGGPRPHKRGGRTLFTVYDVLWDRYPELFTKRGAAWHRERFAYVRDAADKIVTISGRSAASIALLGVDTGRIVIIPPGCDHLPEPDVVGTTALLKDIGVEGPFLLAVSTLEPRKNLQRLVEAFVRLPPPLSCHLVVVGAEGWGEIKVSGERVHRLGHLPAPVLTGLIKGAAALCYVPLEEGYGLPVVEAFHMGTPVVSSDVPAAEGASRLCDPLDPDSIASAIEDVLSDSVLREGLIDAGHSVARGRTWLNAKRSHVELYRSFVAQERV